MASDSLVSQLATLTSLLCQVLILIGQAKLKQSSVVVVGAGGLGCPALQYLAAAGIGTSSACVSNPVKASPESCTGTIGIVDDDTVELSNLNRQILHTELSLGEFKAKSAADSIKR